jgi:hypothetical protein
MAASRTMRREGRVGARAHSRRGSRQRELHAALQVCLKVNDSRC